MQAGHLGITMRSASTMALTFVAGSRKFELSGADVQRYPDSMLHRLLETVDAVDGPLILQVANVPGSLLATWPGAVEVTVAAYKNKPLAVTTLNDLLAQNTEAQLYDMVSLLDFLAVPEPPEEVILWLLPSRHTCMRSFLHAGVLGLHNHILARQTADLIFWAGPACCNTVAGSSALGKIYPTAAFFYITLVDPVHYGGSGVRVYAVSSDCWPVHQQLGDGRNFEPGAILAGRDATTVQLPSKPPKGDHIGSSFMGERWLSALKTNTHNYGTAVGAHQDGLGIRLATVLREAVRGVSVDGRTSAIKVSCIPRFKCGVSLHEQPLWVLHW